MRAVMILVCLLLGAVIGGILGFMIGLGALAIPGLGPLVAAGTLATALGTAGVGVVAGMLVGGLLGVFLSMIVHRPRSRL